MKFLADANVLSEPTRPVPSERVVGWLRRNERELAVNPIVLGELEYGILVLPAGRRRTPLRLWFAQGIQRIRVLDLDMTTASEWARLLARFASLSPMASTGPSETREILRLPAKSLGDLRHS